MVRCLVVGSQCITDDGDCYVIAEIGHNHQGDLQKARQMFRAAKECGASAVKLQKRDNRTLYTRAMYDMPYNNDNGFGPTYGAHREALEFGRDEYAELKRYAAELGITMFATAFDLASADLLAELDMPAYKIASGDLLNVPLLRHVAAFGRPMFVSTGGGSLEDVQRAYDAVMPINTQLCLLQCTANYPAEPEDMNLRVITTFRERFPDVVIGLSDHQNGIAMALVAYMLGARVIEKHFTLNRAWKGTDHAFSLEPVGMRKLVRDLRRARLALGDGVKRPLPTEAKPLFKMGKKLVAARNLPAGHILRREDIAIKSPNDGLPPYELENIIGARILRDLQEDETILFSDLDATA
ncbi:MAG TPA: N-acetylneuraminate synthase family protein [Anaerolineae bacterium]|nr:N-acetylneuraminate synthase family protein [Anaerolineae bacterium]